MPKYGVTVSGSIYLTVEAESEEEAFEKVSDVCSGEKSLPEAGIPETDRTKAMLEIGDWEIDTHGEAER